MRHFRWVILAVTALSASAAAAQQQPNQSSQAIAQTIGQLVIENANLNEQLAALRKQLADNIAKCDDKGKK